MKGLLKRRYMRRMNRLLRSARANEFPLCDWLSAVRSFAEARADRREAKRYGVQEYEAGIWTDEDGTAFIPVHSRRGKFLYWIMRGEE